MRLAEEHVVRVGAETLRLRPTLRAALRLEREHGLPKLLAGVMEGRLGVVLEILRESTGRTFGLDELAARSGLGAAFAALTEPLLAHLCTLYGLDPDVEARPARHVGEPPSPADTLAKLYTLATGWLGWPPREAWDAAPSEIIAAYEARLEMLRAIHGGSEPDAGLTGPDDSPLDRDGLAALGAL